MKAFAAESKTTKMSGTLPALSALLAEAAGLDARVLPQNLLQRALNRRLRSLGATEAVYLVKVREDAAERAALLEEVLVRETCFFRDAAVFQHLLRWSLGWLEHNPGVLRILSAPCSTGEEAYSIAGALYEAGVAPERFVIDAVDISSVALESVQRAEYAGLTLRNVPQPGSRGFLERSERHWRVIPTLRERVRARGSNLAAPGGLRLPDGSVPQYELVLSRNLLLYLHAEARQQLAANLHGVLAPGGRLILGTADWGTDLLARFALEEPIESFALRAVMLTPATAATPKQPGVSSASKPAAERASLLAAREQHLAEVTRWHRAALLAHASHREREAERFCRKALYLEPEHLPSLELLAAVLPQRAPTRLHAALRMRLQRQRATGDSAA